MHCPSASSYYLYDTLFHSARFLNRIRFSVVKIRRQISTNVHGNFDFWMKLGSSGNRATVFTGVSGLSAGTWERWR